MIRKYTEKYTQYTIVRYIISGCTSASVNLVTLYIFNSIVGLYYLTASIVAFICAFFVSLVLHKFWTFQDHSLENVHKQGIMYLMNSLFGLSLNTMFMYIFVSLLHIWVLLAQVIAGLLVASCTFFISKHFVFKR